jgi:hypothetical protein
MPFVLSVVSTLCAITMPTFIYLPLVGRPWALHIERIDMGAALGVLGVFLETGIMMGILLWILRCVSLPAGTITLIFVLYCLLTMLTNRNPIFLPIWLIVGVLSDAAMVVLKPASGVTWRFRSSHDRRSTTAGDADGVAKSAGRPVPGERDRQDVCE